ncbi:YkvA family protein [Methylopila musalis]|uniref:YkvA family protein n=1 Tax=Methylopila musalis TaxID=1134781 RepID=A0ABW3Z8S6_9HYPH
MLRWLRQRFLRFRREAVLLAYAVRDPDTPWGLRIASLAAALYLLSPIDLIPITTPVFGVVDDLVIVPWITALVARRLPENVRLRAGHKADVWTARWLKRPLLVAAVALAVLVAIWIGVLWLIARWLWGAS